MLFTTHSRAVTWERVTVDYYTGESIGYCQSEQFVGFTVALIIVMLIPAGFTAVMAWKTRDVDAAFSESSWIFGLIAVQLELVIIGAPVVAILREFSMNGRYVGYSLILWSYPMSTLIFMMCPKLFAYWKSLRNERAKRKRGARSGGEVSGFSSSGVPPDHSEYDNEMSYNQDPPANRGMASGFMDTADMASSGAMRPASSDNPDSSDGKHDEGGREEKISEVSKSHD